MANGAQLSLYIDPSGVDHLLSQFFCVPIALSKLLSFPATLLPAFRHKSPIVIVRRPRVGDRQFKAIMTSEHLRKCLEKPGEGKRNTYWKDVADAFHIEENYGLGTKWDAQTGAVSSAEPVVPHPEVELIQYLLDIKQSDEAPLHAYIACSSTPCYASIKYAGAVNDVHKECHLTMRTDSPAWCRLASAQPWILPEDTAPEVVSKMEDELMKELSWLISDWSMERFLAGPIP